MSFEKAINQDEEYSGGRRQPGKEYMCSYCCKNVKPDEPIVIWDGVHISVSEFEAQLEPITRLAAQTNLSKWRQKYDNYSVALVWHTHCAVLFGGHLVKDGFNDPNVSQMLRKKTK